MSMNQRIRNAWKNHMNDLSINHNRKLYFMTVTYKPYQDKIYKDNHVNTFFKNFYTHKFLPYLINKNYHRDSKRHLQPISLVFLEEHEPKADKNDFAVRLHHHAVLAVHDETIPRMNNLVGDDTLIQFSESENRIMTSNIQYCDADAVMYSSYMMNKYLDYMIFPD